MKAMRLVAVSICLLAGLCAGGCAWQEIPPPPAFQVAETIPIRVGAMTPETPVSTRNVPRIIKRLRDRRVFDAIVYPYQYGDEIDAFLVIEMTGGWDTYRYRNTANLFLIGLSFGALSPWLGLDMKGHHELTAQLSVGSRKVGRYWTYQETYVRWGVDADTREVSRKALDVQMDWLAKDLAEQLQADRARICEEVGRQDSVSEPNE